MKKKIFKIAVFVFPIIGFAQIGVPQTVYDPTAAANMSTQIGNTTQQIKQLDKSLEYLQKANDAVNKVNGYVRDVVTLNEISMLYRQSVSLASQIRNNLSRIKSANTRNRVANDVSNILSTLTSSIQFVNQILTNNFFKMTDKERLDLLKEERRNVFFQKSRLVGMTL